MKDSVTGTSGRPPTLPATIHDSALAQARANLVELERHLPHAESRYNACQDAYLDAEAALDSLKERIGKRRAELVALHGE